MIKYTIVMTCQPKSKSRIRTVLKLMGAENIHIEEREIGAADPKPKKDNVPTSEAAKLVATLFGRKHDAEWADEEIAAYKKAAGTMLNVENMKIVAEFYRTDRKRDGNFCRTSILTFCRHFGTELDKARAAKPKGDKSLEWADSRPKIEALPDPAEIDRIRAEAKEHAKKLRENIA